MDTIEQYILDHIDPEDDYLYRLYRATNVHLLRGRMASGHLQGRLLKMLVHMIRPTNILEVGTFSGYSAICMAEGLEEGGRVYTFEINDELEDFTRPWIEGSPVGHRIEFIIGDAVVEAPKLGISFDMAFIDGDKRTYLDCYEMALRVVKPEDSSWLTIRCGTDMCSRHPRQPTGRQRGLKTSTISWLAIREWSALSCRYATDSRSFASNRLRRNKSEKGNKKAFLSLFRKNVVILQAKEKVINNYTNESTKNNTFRGIVAWSVVPDYFRTEHSRIADGNAQSRAHRITCFR